MNTENILSVLVVLDFTSASVDFHFINDSQAQEDKIEEVLTELGYSLDGIQYMYSKDLSSNVYEITESIEWLQTQHSEELQASEDDEL